MTVHDPLVKRYFRSIRSWLPCSRRLKRQIMEQIESRVSDYLGQNPTADFAVLKAQFGEPQSIAAAYVENTGTAEILKALRIRRRVFTIVVAAVMIILLTWAGSVTWAITQEGKNDGGYVEVIVD